MFISASEAICAGGVSQLPKQLFMSLVDPVLWPFIQTSHQSVLGRSGDTAEEGGKLCLEVPPSELQVMAVGLDALGFEWHVAGLAPGQALGWPERHVPARARDLSSR